MQAVAARLTLALPKCIMESTASWEHEEMSDKSSHSRRKFLAIGGAALAAPYVVPGSALGREGATPPSERIAMGFCGIGTQGGGHLFGGAWTYLPGGYLARRDVQVLGVCDVRHRKADDAKIRVEQFYAKQAGMGSFSGCRAYYDIRDMLLRDDIDAVLIAAAYHAAGVMASLAVRAGKDVYCEKPTSISHPLGPGDGRRRPRHQTASSRPARSSAANTTGGSTARSTLVRGGRDRHAQTGLRLSTGGGFNMPPRGGFNAGQGRRRT